MSTILTCPECTTGYQLNNGALGAAGRKVKCQKCGHVWFAAADAGAKPAPLQAGSAPAPAGRAAGAEAPAPEEPTAPAEPTPEAADGFAAAQDAELSEDAAWGEEASAPEEEAAPEEPLQATDPNLADGEALDDGGWGWDVDGDKVQRPGEAPGPDAAAGPRADGGKAAARNDEGLESIHLDHGLDEEEEALRKVLAGTSLARGSNADVETAAMQVLEKAASAHARRAAARKLIGQKASRVAAFAAAFGLIAAGLLYFRAEMVRVLPGTASLYAALGAPVNLRGLEFQNVSVDTVVEDGLSILSVRGEVVNLTDRPLAVPGIRFSVRDEARREIYHWTGQAEQNRVAPKDRARFSTRLASPPIAGEQVQIRFVRSAGG